MARVLEMTFSTEMGKTKTIRVVDAKDPLPAVDVAACMDNIIAKNVFSSSSGNLSGKVKAQVITTTTADVALT